MPLGGLIIAGAISIVAILIFGVWGFPVFLLAALILGGYLLVARRGDGGEAIGTVERGRRTEPTGEPRKSSTGAETANERVGQ